VQLIQELAKELDVDVLAKVIFSFTPDIILSPLALPRRLLDDYIESIIPNTPGALRDILLQLGTRPTFEEQWPAEYQAGLRKGKARIEQLEAIRGDRLTLADILFKQDTKIYEWYKNIT